MLKCIKCESTGMYLRKETHGGEKESIPTILYQYGCIYCGFTHFLPTPLLNKNNKEEDKATRIKKRLDVLGFLAKGAE